MVEGLLSTGPTRLVSIVFHCISSFLGSCECNLLETSISRDSLEEFEEVGSVERRFLLGWQLESPSDSGHGLR